MEKELKQNKKETLEEAAKNYIENIMRFSFNSLETKTQANRMLKCVEFGSKWQQERMYSEDDMIMFADFFHNYKELLKKEKWEILELSKKDILKKWFEQFSKLKNG